MFFLLLYLAALIGLLFVLDRRLHAAQLRRESAYLSAVLPFVSSGSRRPVSALVTSHLAPCCVPLRSQGRAAERCGGVK